MKQTLLIAVAVMVGLSAFAGELRLWTLAGDQTIEAEFVSVIGDKVVLKKKRGKVVKVPRRSISREDLVYIDLCQPPALDFSFSKKTKLHVYPPLTEWFESNNTPPRSLYYTFSTEIRQTSANAYDHELTAEIFVMAVEVDGGKNILIDYRKEPFRLNEENKRTVNIPGAEALMLTTYVSPGGYWRGEKFAGYMVVVNDSRGEIIAHTETRSEWFDNLENIRKVPVGKTFDKEGNRCWPTRPRELDY